MGLSFDGNVDTLFTVKTDRESKLTAFAAFQNKQIRKIQLPFYLGSKDGWGAALMNLI